MESTEHIAVPSISVRGKGGGPPMATCEHFAAFSGRSQLLTIGMQLAGSGGVLRTLSELISTCHHRQTIAHYPTRRQADR